jgi:lysophospholipase L1-like esterase
MQAQWVSADYRTFAAQPVVLPKSLMLDTLQNIWSLMGLLLLAAVLLEALLQLLHGARGGRGDPREACDAYTDRAWLKQHLADCNALGFVWQPYTGFRHSPFAGRTVTVDNDGLRADGGVQGDVWMFGGSTVFGVGAGDRATIPALLSAQAGRPVRNMGTISHVSTQEIIALAERLKRGERPALVVFYDGVNDAICAVQSGRAGWPYAAANRAREFMLLNRRSPLMWATLQAWFPRLGKRLARPAASAAGTADPAAVVALYAENMRQLRALAAAYGFPVLAVWQPILYGKVRMTAYEAEVARLFAGEASSFCTAVYAARRTMSPLPGMLDLGSLLDDVPHTLFLDPFHLTEDGNRRVADALLPHVRAALDDSSRARG